MTSDVSTVDGLDELSHEVVEGRTQLMYEVAKDDSEDCGRVTKLMEFNAISVRLGIWLCDEKVWARVEPPRGFAVEFVQVVFGPSDLCSAPIKRIGHGVTSP